MKKDNIEMIENIKLDLSYYPGEDKYSDGDVEDKILYACKSDKGENLLRNSTDYAVLYHLSELRYNLVQWLPFRGDEKVLEIGSGCGAITGMFAQKAKEVVCVELSKKRSLINAHRNKAFSNISIMVGNFQEIEPDLGNFDIITLIGVLEYSPLYIKSESNPFVEFLTLLKRHLKSDGRILIAIENKMGLKYFNGAWEDHLMRQYDGINDYLSTDNVRTFSKQELEVILNKAGYNEASFYYPNPDYKLPEMLYSDKYLPKPSEIRTFGKNYQGVQFYNFYDMVANDQICNDGVFDYFSNSFFVVVGKEYPVKYARFSRERLPKFRVGTLIREDSEKEVLKYALTEEAKNHITNIKRNEDIVRLHLENTNSHLKCANGRLSDDGYISEYIEGKNIQIEFYELRHDIKKIIALAKKYVDEYFICQEQYMEDFVCTKEFEKVFGKVEMETKTMKVTNIDCIFSNMIKTSDGDIYLIDCEWVFDFPIPYEYPIWRAISILYDRYSAYLNRKTNINDFALIFGLDSDKVKTFRHMDSMFTYYVCGMNSKEVISKQYEKESIGQTNRRL